MEIRNTSNSVVAQYKYNAWGELLSSSGTMASVNPLRYRGYYYDSETGFYYLGSRYYDPVICRFINADNQLDEGAGLFSTNLFVYRANNPVIYRDDSGNFIALALAIAGGVILLGMAMVMIAGDYTLTTEFQRSWNRFLTGLYYASKPKTTTPSNSLGGSSPASPQGPNNNKKNPSIQESKVWRSLENYKNGTKTSGSGRTRRYYQWDYTHNDIEVYDANGRHLGSMDPTTGQMYKPPVPGRTITIN